MMEHSQVVCLRLIDEISQRLNHHCSLCLFLNDVDDCGDDGEQLCTTPAPCSHNNNNSNNNHNSRSRISRPCTPGSDDASFHTAVSTPTSDSVASTITRNTARARATHPRLRRRASPTHISLRDLEAQHAQQVLRAKQSEEQLQRVYESQVWQYLNGAFACLPNIQE